MTSYKIIKVITNNIVRALDINDKEVILIGKGIGFQKHSKDIISSHEVESVFVLQSNQECSLYEQLLKTTSPKLIEIANQVIVYIQKNFSKPLNEHIHIALTDHIAFMVRRCKMGLPIDNPFSFEIQNFYPEEYKIAKDVVFMLENELCINIPSGEISFITLHIISSLTNDPLSAIQKSTVLIAQLIETIEETTNKKLDKTSLNYTRLITHLRFAIERIKKNEMVKTPPEFEKILKKQYPQCYALAYKLITIMENHLHIHVEKSEAVYLTLHLYRFVNIK